MPKRWLYSGVFCVLALQMQAAGPAYFQRISENLHRELALQKEAEGRAFVLYQLLSDVYLRNFSDSATWALTEIAHLRSPPANNRVDMLFHFASAKYWVEKQDLDKAQKHCDSILVLHQKSVENWSLAQVLYLQGFLLAERHQYEQALPYYWKAIQIAETIPDPLLQSRCYFFLGHLFFNLGNYSLAKEHLNLAVATAEAGRDTFMLFRCYKVLASVHHQQANETALLHALQTAKSLAVGMGEPDPIGTSYRKLAAFYLSENLLEPTKRHLDTSMLFLSQGTNPFEKYETNRVFSKYFTALHQVDSALVYGLRAAQIMEQNGSTSDRCFAYLDLSDIYLENSDWKRSQETLKMAEEMASLTGAPDLLEEVHLGMYEFFRQRNNPEAALKHLLAYHQYRDSSKLIELSRQDIQLKLTNQYEREKAATDIELANLQREKELQNLRLNNEKLWRWLFGLAALLAGGVGFWFFEKYQHRRLLQLRQDLAQDLHDELGSEMSSVALRSYSASRQRDPVFMSDTLQGISEQSGKLVEEIRYIVWSLHPENDTLEKLALRMRSYALDLFEGLPISLSMQIDARLQGRLKPETRKHLFFFFKETLNNLLKHAAASQAQVIFKREGTDLLLEICDNGVGFDPNITANGNGLRNLYRRAELLHGKLSIESASAKGTCIKLVVPLNSKRLFLT